MKKGAIQEFGVKVETIDFIMMLHFPP